MRKCVLGIEDEEIRQIVDVVKEWGRTERDNKIMKSGGCGGGITNSINKQIY
jgi:hypothetical protein